ncbi:MAG TPA: phosphatidate cytidylyltransferase [Jiangellales bacterium]|nr:phosphatidate cytidylyltransferase [Jiangellales bacterium]
MVASDGAVPPAPASPGHGRAGRDIKAAVAVGVVLAVLIVGTLVVAKAAFVTLVTVAICLAVLELSSALAQRQVRVPVVPVLLGAVAMLVGGYVAGPGALSVALALTVLAVMVWRLGDTHEGYVRDTTAGAFAALYVPFLAGFALLMLRPDDGAARVATFLLVAVASDVGGYAVGVVAGRHPLAPTISPKKSWEGVAGSVLACVLVGVASVVLLLDGPWWAGALLGLLTAVSATLGDLGESMIKRDLGIKDMGSLLPGHGGLMDRLDSLLPTAPLAWLVLTALVPVT